MAPEDMAVKLAEVEHKAKSNTRRLERLEIQVEAIQRLATSVEILAREQGHQTEAINGIKSDVAKLDGKVDALEQKPAKRWDSIVEKVIWFLISLVLGFIAAMLGFGNG